MQLPMGSSSPPSSTGSPATKTTATISGGTTPNVVTPLFTAPIEEQPADKYIEALGLVAQGVTAKIAYHQAQIDALRRALKPFNELAKQVPAVGGDGGNEAVDQLLAIARQLGSG